MLEYASINKDFTIDVNGDVILTGYKLKEIPFQFKMVNGDFLCDGCGLTSLKGCPEEVTGLFDCGCNSLTSLEGCPKRCGVFSCEHNKLTSLKGCPDYVQSFQRKVTSLLGRSITSSTMHIISQNSTAEHPTNRASILNIILYPLPKEAPLYVSAQGLCLSYLLKFKIGRGAEA